MSEELNGAVAVKSDEVTPSNNEVAQEAPSEQNAAQQRQPTKMESFFSILKSIIVRGLIIYFVTSFFRRPAPQTTTNPSGPSGPTVPSIAARNFFPNGTALTLHVYISEKEHFTDFSENSLVWMKDNLIYGDWTSGENGDGTYTFETEYPITENLQKNGSLYLHAYLTKQGESPNPKHENFAKKHQFSYTKKMLNRFKKPKISGTKNLLTGESEQEDVENNNIISHWHPNVTINLVTDHTQWTYGSVPAPMDEYIQFIENGKFYKPVLFVNDFWNLAKDYKPLNESLPFQITFQPLSLFKWQLYAAQNMRQKWNIWGQNEDQQNDDDQDTLKETLLDTNPYLLGITFVVSILHSVFELLAFKNDIQFWNNRNSLEGLSVRSVFFSVFQSLIVLLYVLDNETNFLVRVGCFVGLGIELWKIQKVVDIKFENGTIRFKDKGSYVESSTRQYDELAFKYLSWVCFPLLVGYSIYALFYLEHKGWYSFVLDLLYGYLLTFGFIMMTPQLFINYKMKSVAHLPWRMLTYKFLNTFIDDMFAFVIKMPTMYRIGCFRDDIIFLVFLYQRWIYPVDKTRRNEFGYAEEPQQSQAAIEDKKTQ